MAQKIEREDAVPFGGEARARRIGAARGKPAKAEGEDGEDQHAEPEIRHGARRQHDRDRHGFEHRAALPGEQRAEEAAKRIGDEQCGHGEQQRVRQHRDDEPRYRLAVAERQPEFALGGVLEKDQILLGERLIEAELLQHELALLAGEVRVDIGRRRIAGHQTEHQEQDGRDRPQYEQHVQEAPAEIGHAGQPWNWWASVERKCRPQSDGRMRVEIALFPIRRPRTRTTSSAANGRGKPAARIVSLPSPLRATGEGGSARGVGPGGVSFRQPSPSGPSRRRAFARPILPRSAWEGWCWMVERVMSRVINSIPAFPLRPQGNAACRRPAHSPHPPAASSPRTCRP